MAVQHVRKVPFQRITPLEKEAQRQLSRNFDTVVSQLVPTGTGPIPWSGKDGLDPPQGWLLCNGQAVSRTAYASLFRVIGTTFGSGDGSTTFNVPDMDDRFARGTNIGSGVGVEAGSAAASMPSHNHGTFNGSSGTVSAWHTHGITVNGNNFNTGLISANHVHSHGHSHQQGSVVFMNCSATHGHAGGAGQPSESPSFGGCTGFGANFTSGGPSTAATAGVSVNHVHNANHGHSASSGNPSANHSHTINHTHASEGSGDNNPPFTDFRFIIKT